MGRAGGVGGWAKAVSRGAYPPTIKERCRVLFFKNTTEYISNIKLIVCSKTADDYVQENKFSSVKKTGSLYFEQPSSYSSSSQAFPVQQVGQGICVVLCLWGMGVLFLPAKHTFLGFYKLSQADQLAAGAFY